MSNILQSRAVSIIGALLKCIYSPYNQNTHITTIYHFSAVPTTGTRSIGNKTGIARGSDARWRNENGLPANRSSFGPLTNLPDYTFMDGRPTPLGVILPSPVIIVQIHNINCG